MELFTLALGCAVLVLAYFLSFVKSKRVGGDEIPGPLGLPWLGSALAVDMGRMHLTFEQWTRSYGNIFKVCIFGKRIVVLNDVDLVKKAFSSIEFGKYFCDRPSTYVGKSIVYDSQDLALNEHYGARFKAMKKMFESSLKHCMDSSDYKQQLGNELDRLTAEIEDHIGEDIDVTSMFQRSLADASSILVAGQRAGGTGREQLWKFNDNILFLLEHSNNMLLGTLPILKYLPGRIRTLYRNAEESKAWIIKNLFDDIKADGDAANDSMIKRFIQQQQDTDINKTGMVTDDNMKGTVLDIAVAAMKSTTSSLCGVILLLQHRPEIARWIQQEIDDVVGETRAPTLNDRQRMPRNRATVYEAVRYLSVAPLGLPHLVSEDKIFEGYNLRKGDIVYSNLWHINRYDTFWGDGDVFRPERFLDEQGDLLPADHQVFKHFIPFSVGRRQCPGKDLGLDRIFLYVTRILQRFDVCAPSDGRLTSVEPSAFLPGLFMTPNQFDGRFVARVK